MLEFSNADVTGQCGLLAFFTEYADADVGRCDHCDIIATVTDGQTDALCFSLDEFDHFGLLGRSASADEHRWGL